jgi:hypothetical protein
MNGKPESGNFRRRIYWYVVITAVVQFLLGILFEITSNWRGPIAVLYFIILVNFAYLLFGNGISYTLYPTAIIIGTFFMFLMIVALGEIYHQLGKSIPSDPLLEEARRHASHE